MKTFEITFTRDQDSGIFSANIVHAASADQATAYYMEKGYTVIGCDETTSRPKPGQPVTIVPEDWKAPEEEEETTTRTAEEITADIIAYFESNEEEFNQAIEELDSYNGYLGDDRYYSMDDLDELYNGVEPSEILARAFYGYDEDTYTTDSAGNREYRPFNPNREYFRFNGYGNLVSTNYKDYSAQLDEYAIDAMSDNRCYIDSIEDSEELAALFDELEEAKANEE